MLQNLASPDMCQEPKEGMHSSHELQRRPASGCNTGLCMVYAHWRHTYAGCTLTDGQTDR